MIILGIETSCDETAVAVVKDGREILSNIVATSCDIHATTGGIIPEQAARQQIVSMVPVLKAALNEANMSIKNVDALAITSGPGLIGSLLVGVETAKTLAVVWNKPIIPVNHLYGHVYANWLMGAKIQLPAAALIVSGGHTDLVLMNGHEKFEWLGGTRDDAAGEAFDKTARILGLPYPGGPAISAEADKYLSRYPKADAAGLKLFPRPMIMANDFDWSFSGLKTAVLNEVRGKKLNDKDVQKYSAEIQEAIADVLVTKTLRAVTKHKPKSLILSGGVAANRRLKDLFRSKVAGENFRVEFHVPIPALCTDNAAMIAAAAHFLGRTTDWTKVVADPSLTADGF